MGTLDKNKPAGKKKRETTPIHVSKLILLNDDVNTFDYVIEKLIEICKIGEFQAEQLALLVHFKGSAILKHGEEDFLRPLCTKLTNSGLTAEIKK